MFTPCSTTTRPRASTTQRPSLESGAVAAGRLSLRGLCLPLAPRPGARSSANATTAASATATACSARRSSRLVTRGKLAPAERFRAAGRGGPGDGRHAFDGRAREAADDDDVERRLVGAQLATDGELAGLRHADGALGLPEALEVVAIAVVKVAIEALLLEQAVLRVLADGGAHIPEDGRR